jgi:hypothetical protein
MGKIYISTTCIKASDCFKPREETFRQQLSQIVFPNDINCITQFKETQIYFHLDSSNPSDIIIDAENDYLIKHSQSNKEFCARFNHILPSIHNNEKTSKFRQVFKILLDDTIENKYTSIFNILKTCIDSLQTSDTTLFLKDICNKEITLKCLIETHPDFTRYKAFLEVFYNDDSNVFDCNNPTHITAFNQLREKLNHPN